MAASVAVVGPGRVGSALARLWSAGGLRVLGFHGRSREAVATAVAFAGSGRELARLAAVREASAVLVAVPDHALAEVAAAALAEDAVRPCALWFHCSGSAGLEPFEALAQGGARIGALHPLCPVPDAETGARLLPGRRACLLGDAAALRFLRVLATKAGLVPFADPGFDRALYHAACALAANGVTALHAAAARAFASAGAAPADAAELAASLLEPALGLSCTLGPAAALSGPVRRGDAARVANHLAALARSAPELVAPYRALMRQALRLAYESGLPQDRILAVARVLADGAPW